MPPASFRFHLTMNTLAFGYVIPAIRAYSGLAPVRQCSCRAYYKELQLVLLTAVFFVPNKTKTGVFIQIVLKRHFRRKKVRENACRFEIKL